jgi:AAA domain
VALLVGSAIGWGLGHVALWSWRLMRGVSRLAWRLVQRATHLAWRAARRTVPLTRWVVARTAWLTLALLALGFNRRWAAWCLAAAVSGRRGRGGFGGVLQEKRTPDTGHRALPPPTPKAVLRPVPAQRIALATYARRRYWTRAFDGPELLEMLCGPAGTGKTEVKLGQLRAGLDGEPFCGLPTSASHRVLLLSEMGGATLQPALWRWGFVTAPKGRADAVRLRYVPPKGYAGGVIDVVYAPDVYAPRMVDGVLQETDWAAVVLAVLDLVRKGLYDRVWIDSLGEWMGSDNNERMLSTLGACRLLTHAGAGVTVLHHTPRSDPYRPRGGTVIDAKLDIGWSVTGIGDKGKTRSRSDPVRRLDWFKTRFPEDTPPDALTVERVWDGPESGALPRYRLVGDQQAVVEVAAAEIREETRPVPVVAPPPAAPTVAPGPPPAPSQQDRVRAALLARGAAGGTVGDLAKETGIPRQRVDEAVKVLCGRSLVFQRGTVVPAAGGKAAARYVATASLLAAPAAAPPSVGGPGGPRG